jgi:hypothetical protein
VGGVDPGLARLIEAIARGDEPAVAEFLDARPELAQARLEVGATRAEAKNYFLDEIAHYVYAGDTALHVAAAAHSPGLVTALCGLGAEVAATNRRGAQPLHYAVDGGPEADRSDPGAQTETVRRLLAAGADPNATDQGGTTPLHRAIRNRSAAAVEVLLAGGADARRPNGRGSTPLQLAEWTTGKGGSGTRAAKAQQAVIVRLLAAHADPAG